MDIAQKLKRMSEKASKESFAFRFYKTGDSGADANMTDRSFKEVEWFSHRKTIEQLASQGGSLELDSPMIGRMSNNQNDINRRSSSLTRKLSSTHYLHQNEIMDSLEQRGFMVNEDLKHRSTKIICTLGKSTKHIYPIKQMIKKGMDIARLNMNYFETHEQQEIVNNIKTAAQQLGKMLPIMVDLKGPLIRTLGFKDMYSIKVESGQDIRISSNQQILGDDGMFIIDYENIHEKLSIGDKLLVDYGGIILTVVGFEPEEKYLKMKQRMMHQSMTPKKDDRKSDEKSYRKKRKYSANEDEFIQEEIQELINEENQEEEEVKEQRSSRLNQDKRDSLFPQMPKLDTTSHSTRGNPDELDQEEAIYQSLIKKSHRQTNAQKFAKKAEQARSKQQKQQMKLNKTASGDLMIYSDLHSDTQSPLPQKTLSSSLSGYQMKRISDGFNVNEKEGGGSGTNAEHLHLAGSQSHQASSFKLQVSKEYLSRKRMSRDEFMRDKSRILKGFKKPPRSRKSNSPTHSRNQNNQHDHNTSFSISESDNLSFLGAKDNTDKNIQSADILDFSLPLYHKERMLVVCRAENDGELKENKPIYIPSLDWQKDLKLSVLGPKDIKVLHNSIQQGVQIVAVSFVQSKEDISYVRKVLGPKGQHIKVLAKLQTNKSLENFDEILEAADGIIIARGYLGIVLESLEDVVYIQKYIIKKCNLVGKPVILSTQIMESMVSRLMPSRAEVVDISNAVYDGIDALILSPETAIGNFYEQATKVMGDICFEAETHINYMKRYNDQQNFLKSHNSRPKDQIYSLPINLLSTEETISSCAVKASFDVKASLIIVFTHSGFTARKVAKHKPKCQVLAVTPNDWAAKAVLLHRGVQAMLVGSLVGSDTLINKVLEEAVNRKLSMTGDFVVITSGLSGTVGSTNLLKIIKV